MFFFFKQKTAYEMRISDWSSDVCSSDLEMIRMTMDDGAEIAVYHAQPEGDRRGGLVLIQEIFGVTDHIRELCDEYAADGYEVQIGRASCRERVCQYV